MRFIFVVKSLTIYKGEIKMTNLNLNQETNQKERRCKSFFSNHRKFMLSALIVLFVITGLAGFGFMMKVKGVKDRMREDGPLMFLLDKVAKDLNLTDQQKTDVEKIREEIKQKIESKRTKHEDSFDEFENLFKSDNLNKDALKQLAQKHETDREEMKEFFLEELVKFHSLLTPEQRNSVTEKMRDFRMKKDMMREHFDKDCDHHKGPKH